MTAVYALRIPPGPRLSEPDFSLRIYPLNYGKSDNCNFRFRVAIANSVRARSAGAGVDKLARELNGEKINRRLATRLQF